MYEDDPYDRAIARIRMGEHKALFGHPTNGNAATEDIRRFDTGAVRSADAEGTRYDLISPVGLRRLAETCAEGAAKYGDMNYEKGMPVDTCLNHAIRHLYLYLSGDRSEDHLAHAAWNCFASMHSEELWPRLNEGRMRREGCVPPNVTDEEASGWGRPRAK